MRGSNYNSSDGIVNMSNTDFALDEDAAFNYKVVISKGDTVITSASKKVTVKAAASGTAAIESAKIFLASDAESGTIRLTVNKLNGEDLNGVPGNATSVSSQNISVTDLVN